MLTLFSISNLLGFIKLSKFPSKKKCCHMPTVQNWFYPKDISRVSGFIFSLKLLNEYKIINSLNYHYYCSTDNHWDIFFCNISEDFRRIKPITIFHFYPNVTPSQLITHHAPSLSYPHTLQAYFGITKAPCTGSHRPPATVMHKAYIT